MKVDWFRIANRAHRNVCFPKCAPKKQSYIDASVEIQLCPIHFYADDMYRKLNSNIQIVLGKKT